MGWHGPQTARQFAAWCEWHHDEMNRPGSVEHYLMALRLMWVSDADNKTLEDMRLEFRRGGSSEDDDGLTDEEAAAFATAKWLTVTGAKLKPANLD